MVLVLLQMCFREGQDESSICTNMLQMHLSFYRVRLMNKLLCDNGTMLCFMPFKTPDDSASGLFKALPMNH